MDHRIEAWFTFERRIGVMMIAFAITLFLRPFASGLDMLRMVYGVAFPPPLFGYWLLIGGLLLLITREVGALLFGLIFFPVAGYAVLLWVAFFQNPLLGPLGQDYSTALVGWVIVGQARRALARKRLRKGVSP